MDAQDRGSGDSRGETGGSGHGKTFAMIFTLGWGMKRYVAASDLSGFYIKE